MNRPVNIEDIEKLIDADNPDVYSWDKGDCSLVGLIRILLIQEIKKAKADPWEDRWTKMLEHLESNGDN